MFLLSWRSGLLPGWNNEAWWSTLRTIHRWTKGPIWCGLFKAAEKSVGEERIHSQWKHWWTFPDMWSVDTQAARSHGGSMNAIWVQIQCLWAVPLYSTNVSLSQEDRTRLYPAVFNAMQHLSNQLLRRVIVQKAYGIAVRGSMYISIAFFSSLSTTTAHANRWAVMRIRGLRKSNDCGSIIAWISF